MVVGGFSRDAPAAGRLWKEVGFVCRGVNDVLYDRDWAVTVDEQHRGVDNSGRSALHTETSAVLTILLPKTLDDLLPASILLMSKLQNSFAACANDQPLQLLPASLSSKKLSPQTGSELCELTVEECLPLTDDAVALCTDCL